MSSLGAAIRLDLRLQVRNGFYHAVAFVLVCWLVLLTQLPEVDWGYILPAVVYGNLVMVNFYFVAGLVLLEKTEGTLQAQVVTPLSGWEYLASKAVTLAGLALIEQVAIVWAAYGAGFAALPLASGTVLAAILFTLVGFLLVARYQSINDYLFPSVLFVMVLSLPLLHYFDLWDTWLLFVHPLSAPLALVAGAFGPIPPWQYVYGVLYALLWAALLLAASRRSFERLVVNYEGNR